MELVKRWKAYRGFTDERVEIEMNRIYKAGFLMLLGGYLVYLYYALALKQAQMMVDVMATGTGSMSLALPELLLFVWFLITVSQRKEESREGRFAVRRRVSEQCPWPSSVDCPRRSCRLVVDGEYSTKTNEVGLRSKRRVSARED